MSEIAIFLVIAAIAAVIGVWFGIVILAPRIGRMLDKQVYRNMAEVTDDGLRDIAQRYAAVAELTSRWGA